MLLAQTEPEAMQDAGRLSPEQVQFFETKIRPVLVEHCYRCHSADGQSFRGGLGVDHREALLAGGESGPAIVPGDLDASVLWNAINYVDYKMPPSGRLPARILEDFKAWIEMGAPDPRVHEGVVVNAKVTAEDIQQGRSFWSFQPPVPRDPPSLPSGEISNDWSRTPIDRWVAVSWAQHGMTPVPIAEAHQILRRLTFDLVGLPPTDAQRSRFLEQYPRDPDAAVAELVDALLDSPQYGERWGRHWLDVARYAESSGREAEWSYPNAWRYRDYVIRSFQSDKPYDRFLTEQIAGDLLPVESDAQWNEHLIATGFLAIGPKSLTEQNPRQFAADLVDEQIDTTTRVVLGLSVGCARCHDHKFDPIPQSDYYALAGIFQSTQTLYGGTRSLRNRQPSDWILLPVPDAKPAESPITAAELAELKKELQSRQEQLVEARRAQRTGQPPNNGNGNPLLNANILDQMVAQLTARIGAYDANGKPKSFCMGVQDRDAPRNARVLVRGEIDQPAQEVPRGFVSVLCDETPKLPSKSSGRLELARWLTSKRNPLTARVMANRVWQHLIGQGLVREPDNFGVSGPAPTHPELLDALAVDFMEHDWSIKHLIRTIATSRVYRLSTHCDAERLATDPENLWIARGNVKRLEAESIRDAMLAISQQLDPKPPQGSVLAGSVSVAMGPNGPIAIPPQLVMAAGGPAAARPMPTAMARFAGRNPATNIFELPNYHRSVYLPVARNALPRALDVFDFAEPNLVVGQREVSHTAEQALYMLNHPFVLELSDALARRVLQSSKDPTQRMVHAFQWVYGREPTKNELAAVKKSFEREVRSKNKNTAQPNGTAKQDEQLFQWTSRLCQSLFCSAEFRILR